MAKKQKRNVPQSPRATSTSTGPTSTAIRPSATGLRPSTAAEFNPDYTYAKQDLKRVGIMAGSFIGALIVLAFVLPLFIK